MKFERMFDQAVIQKLARLIDTVVEADIPNTTWKDKADALGDELEQAGCQCLREFSEWIARYVQ